LPFAGWGWFLALICMKGRMELWKEAFVYLSRMTWNELIACSSVCYFRWHLVKAKSIYHSCTTLASLLHLPLRSLRSVLVENVKLLDNRYYQVAQQRAHLNFSLQCFCIEFLSLLCNPISRDSRRTPRSSSKSSHQPSHRSSHLACRKQINGDIGKSVMC
jgi:hypothetical protein